jgi:simple sugar transport system ATP-binding protein
MVGEALSEPRHAPGRAGPVRMRLVGVSAPGLADVTLDLPAGTITGIAGVSGNGQGALAAVAGGMLRPSSGRIEMDGRTVTRWSAQAALEAGVGRIPEDRHREGTVADFSLAENAVLETHSTRFARAGLIGWGAVRAHARRLIAAHDVRCEGPDQPIRLLSGGNMQKLILGRVLDEAPGVLIAAQPVRGLDVGAITHVHARLIAARDAGAAVLLISEDLDEVLGLADRIHAISAGRLSPVFPRGEVDRAGLGLWMAGTHHAA